jgi:ring-1,2-phenylacetyl-CoA epoxidase subunit PaaE
MALAAPDTRTSFHELAVVDRAAASADGGSLAITFDVPPGLRGVFAFTAGQHVTLRAVVDGTEVRRSYSVCSTPTDLRDRGVLRIGVRLLPGGVFSGHAARALAPGSTAEVLPPLGGFVLPATARRGRYAAIAAGSGITPVLSLAAAELAARPGSTFTVVLGNRTAASTMFADELADLKDRYPDRFALTRLFSRELVDVGLAATRLDEPTLVGLLDGVLVPAAVDQWFVCGPYEVVEQARRVLAARGVPPEAVRSELFHAGPTVATAPPPPARDGAAHVLSIRLEGRTTEVRCAPGTSVLDAALPARPELPYSCRTGVCGTCRVRVVTGTVRMPATWTLSDRERSEGYVLACRATPGSDRVTVDFDVA